MKLTLLVITLVLIPFVQADLQTLMDSYSFEYFGEEIDISGVTDFMNDTNSNGNNDTLFFNVSIHNATSDNYDFYIDLSNNGNILTGRTNKTVTAGASSVLINLSTKLLSQNNFTYNLRVYDSTNNLVYREDGFQTQNYSSYEQGYSIISISDANISNTLIRLNVTINSSKS